MDALRALEKADVRVQTREPQSAAEDGPWDAILEIAVGDARARFAVEEKGRAPYPNELQRLDAARR